MTAGEALRRAIIALQKAGVEDAGFDALQLTCFRTGLTPALLRADGDRSVAHAAADALARDVSRRCEGEPLQYILGEWEFYSLPFTVGPGVLIPRADTEILVDEALRMIEDRPAPRVADLCAGSGCVGIALAHERPDAAVMCMELSREAAAYLKQNVVRNRIGNVTLRMADVLVPPRERAAYDLIVSNPPYVRSGDWAGLSTEVRREPVMALDGGDDGLTFFRSITAGWTAALKQDGALAFEVGAGQSRAVAALLDERFEQVYITPDLNGVPRVLTGVYPKA